MIELAFPWAFALLPVPLLVRWLLPASRESVSAMRTPFFRQLAEATGTTPLPGSVVLRRRRSQLVAAALLWIAMLCALARPEWVGAPIEREEPARDVMLALDLSGSMDERDFPGEDGEPVQRLAAVKRVLARFVQERKDDRVGLIVFGAKAFVQAPFTRDLAAVTELVDSLVVGMAGPHTVLGDAIGLAIQTFAASEVEQRLLILLTDGADTNSRMSPVNAATIAARNGVEIYTIGVGDPDSKNAGEQPDFASLKQIAEIASGRFFTAGDEEGLAAVYARIDELVPRETRIRSYRPTRSLVHWPAAASVLLTFAAYAWLLASNRARRNAA